MSLRITVVGGGIIGLACAWRLARDGHRVRVLDAAPEAREASWAAAGMLAPHNEARELDALHALGTASLARWPDFVAHLGVAAEAVDFRRHGSLVPVLDEVDADEVAARRIMLTAAGIETHELSGAELREREPALGAERALWLPAAQVDPRRCTEVLVAACRDRGVDLRYRCAVRRIAAGRVVTAAGEDLVHDRCVLAAGAWTPALAAATGLNLPGEPVKGQMLLFAGGEERIRHFVHCRHAYCVPRADRGVVVGSTMVSAGFDKRADEQAIADLAAGARRVFPHLATVPVGEHWTGLRPRLAGGVPCLERVRDDLILATGHFRNGILLTPITAEIVADLVAERSTAIDLSPFTVHANNR